MAQSLHILVLGSSSGSATWRAQGHRVTELAGRRRLRTAWRTWRGAGRDADVIVEVVDGRSYLTPLWGWLAGPPGASGGPPRWGAGSGHRASYRSATPAGSSTVSCARSSTATPWSSPSRRSPTSSAPPP